MAYIGGTVSGTSGDFIPVFSREIKGTIYINDYNVMLTRNSFEFNENSHIIMEEESEVLSL